MSLLDVRAISNQSKLGDQHYSHAMVKHNPQDSINENYLKNEFISRCNNQFKFAFQHV